MSNVMLKILARTTPLAVFVSVLATLSAATTAFAAPQTAAAPTASVNLSNAQNFDWLYDKSLIKGEFADDFTKDDDRDEDHDDDRESSEYRSTTTTTTTTVSYGDVTSSYWASSYIYRLSSIEVVSGFPGGVFLPSNNLTVAQFAAMVARAYDMPIVRETKTIRTISRNYWAYSAIQKAYAMGFIDIDSDTFNPNAPLTRLDMLLYLARGLNITEVSSDVDVDQVLSVFTDADTIPTQYRVIIAALVERGVLVNYPQVRTLNLYQTVSRSEGCGFVYQSLAYMGKVQKVDSAYVVNYTNLLQNVETTTTTTETNVIETTNTTTVEVDDDDDDDGKRHCNQGIGNGAEGCDPGNSRPHGGSNDEGGRTPGARP